VVHPFERAELTLESREPLGRCAAQRLQGDVHVALVVERFVHDPHPALSERT